MFQAEHRVNFYRLVVAGHEPFQDEADRAEGVRVNLTSLHHFRDRLDHLFGKRQLDVFGGCCVGSPTAKGGHVLGRICMRSRS